MDLARSFADRNLGMFQSGRDIAATIPRLTLHAGAHTIRRTN
jgi:hypothetical protein